MKYQLQATVRWQRTAWQIIVLALLWMTASGLATAQQATQPADKARQEEDKRAKQQAKDLLNAAGKGKTDQLQTLLAQGANIETKDKQGRTALLLAAQNGRVDTVRLLLARGADATVKDNEDSSVFRLALVYGRWEVIDILPKPRPKRLVVITADQGGIFYGSPSRVPLLPDNLVIEEFAKYVRESGKNLVEVVHAEATAKEPGTDYAGPEADAVLLMSTRTGGGSLGVYGDKLTLRVEARLLSLPDKKVLYQKTYGGGLSGFRGAMADRSSSYSETYRQLFKTHVGLIYWNVVFNLGL